MLSPFIAQYGGYAIANVGTPTSTASDDGW